jgi:glycosyltransferase involved in cell wall biosynthesis
MTTSKEARIALVDCPYERDFQDSHSLLARYHSLAGWAESLAEAGAGRVAVVQRFWKDDFVRRGRVDYHFVADGKGPYPPSSFSGERVVRVVDTLGVNIVGVEGFGFPLVVRRLRWTLGRRASIFIRDHGGFHAESAIFRSWRRRAFYRFGLDVADGFLFTAREQATPWLRSGIITATHAVHELPEASTDLPSKLIARDREQRLPGHPALLWVGRLDSNKDPLTVLEGFELAVATLPEAELTLVYGDDLLLPEVKDRIERSPTLRARVHLRGRLDRSALPAVYAGADAFVLGSHREVACFSLIEALSFGLIPVVTNIPPFRVLTDEGRLGGLFTPGNAGELARVLARLGKGDLSARRESVRTHFEGWLSWPALGRRAFAIYSGTVA